MSSGVEYQNVPTGSDRWSDVYGDVNHVEKSHCMEGDLPVYMNANIHDGRQKESQVEPTLEQLDAQCRVDAVFQQARESMDGNLVLQLLTKLPQEDPVVQGYLREKLLEGRILEELSTSLMYAGHMGWKKNCSQSVAAIGAVARKHGVASTEMRLWELAARLGPDPAKDGGNDSAVVKCVLQILGRPQGSNWTGALHRMSSALLKVGPPGTSKEAPGRVTKQLTDLGRWLKDQDKGASSKRNSVAFSTLRDTRIKSN